MRSTIALATLVAFLTAPVAAQAQVAAGAHIDVVNGEIDPYLNVDPYGIAILPGDQPRIESDTKTKVAIGLIGVAVGFGLAMLLNKNKSNDNGGGVSMPTVPSIPPVSVPDGRLPIPGDRGTIGGTGTNGSTPVPGSGTVSVPGGSTTSGSGSGSGEVSNPSGTGSGRVGAGRGVESGSVASNTPGSNVGRNADTRPISTSRDTGYYWFAGTPR